MADITKITSGTLIAAEKVEGTDVYNLQGEKLGTVDDIMIDKVSGKAIYAVDVVRRLPRHRRHFHPPPRSTLEVRRAQGRIHRQSRQENARECVTYDMDEDFRWTPDYGRQVDKYYNAPTYW